MRVLGIDTSSDLLGVAIIKDEDVLVSIKKRRSQGHSDYLIPLIDSALKKTNLSLEDLNGFAVSKGPGSFTGLRIGITALRALSIATDKPIVGVPTLDVISYNVKKSSNNRLVCPILDAKQGKVYACIFKNRNAKLIRQSKYLLLPVEKLTDYIKNNSVIFLGDGIKIYSEKLKNLFGRNAKFLEERFWYPDAGIVAKLGLESLKNGKEDSPYDLVPMYLYPKECTISLRTKK